MPQSTPFALQSQLVACRSSASPRDRAPTENLFGAEQTTLSAAGFLQSHEVSASCNPGNGPDELAIEVIKASPINARGGQLLADWHSGPEHGTLPIPFYLVLCQGTDTSAPDCQAL